jgi:hypothetical protein
MQYFSAKKVNHLKSLVFSTFTKISGMKFLLLVICLAGFSLNGNAQDFGNGSLKIPPGSGLEILPSALPSKPSSLFDKPSSNTGSILPKEKNWNFSKPKTFANSGARYEEKLNKTPLTGEMLFADSNHNQYLGDIKAHSGSIRLYYRDDGSIDGDMVRISINGIVVKESLTLEGDFKGFTIQLQDGFNKIEFEALNDGNQAPNTAQFEIVDEKGNVLHSSSWEISAGYVASVIVVK